MSEIRAAGDSAISMRVDDYYTQGNRSYLRLNERGGRFNQVPAHHLVQEYLDELGLRE